MQKDRIAIVQFVLPAQGRRVGLVRGDSIADVSSKYSEIRTTYDLFFRAHSEPNTLAYLSQKIIAEAGLSCFSYRTLLEGRPNDGSPYLLPPLDHPDDPAHCFISGTGLTHLGSAVQRDAMHKEANRDLKTDSQKMFEMGLQQGKPVEGRGIQPEWFYKGTGLILRGHNDFLDIPGFAQDGGEEPEIVGCYVIDRDGTPHRLGFAVGNEWSDHVMEKKNYLWLAPSKLRTCSIGPELVVTEPFEKLRGRVRIFRGQGLLYESGDILTGTENMTHSLANLEDHHFKYPQFRHPGDVHLHFFGTTRMSFGTCEALEDGDRIEIEFDGMGPPLVNRVRRLPVEGKPLRVLPEYP